MSWNSRHTFGYHRNPTIKRINKFAENEICFIRKDHTCGKLTGVSKSCFIACPNDDNLEPILGLITEKLSKVGIETIIAVKERAYGQDIFCTKICGKIIESKFCIVILDDEIKEETNIPNPNVYYEYGLMTSLGKHIIPLQKEDLKLGFNIQSHDTVKYNPKNIGIELDRAIKDAIKITDEKEIDNSQKQVSEKSILRKLEIAGLEQTSSNWIFSDTIDDTDFRGFYNTKQNSYAYFAKLDDESDFTSIIDDLNVVTYRTEKKFNELVEETKELNEKVSSMKKKERKELDGFRFSYEIYEIEEKIKKKIDILERMKTFNIGFIIKPDIFKQEFIDAIKESISRFLRYKLIYNEGDELEINGKKINVTALSEF